MYFVDFDLNTKEILGFYNDQINKVIPSTAIQITDEQWQSVSSSPHKWLFVDNQFISAPEPIPPISTAPNYGGFIIDMSSNSAYQQVTSTTINQAALRQLEISIHGIAASIYPLIPELFFPLWNATISGSTFTLTQEIVTDWRNIASNNNMPFTYSSNGLMLLV